MLSELDSDVNFSPSVIILRIAFTDRQCSLNSTTGHKEKDEQAQAARPEASALLLWLATCICELLY